MPAGMPRLAMRTCELALLTLLGLLPTHAIISASAPDPAGVLSPRSQPAFSHGASLLLARRRASTCGSQCARQPLISVGSLRGSGVLGGLRAAEGAPTAGRSHAKRSVATEMAQRTPARTKVLVTGGAGYIGSHICADLLLQDYDVVVFDNFANSSPKALQRSMELGGRELTVYEGDTRDLAALRHVFESELTISCVIHLAGLKAVGESVAKPTMYYDYNVAGSINLMQVMSEYNCKQLVFSSSATVYGETNANPIKETEPLMASSPYGRSKLMVEDMLRDLCKADAEMGVAILRYFNPVGAHPSGLLGEDPKGLPNNLMPFITKVATGAQPELKIFGDDYPTKDGTGVRDYLHVMDLSEGHLAAIRALEKGLKVLPPGASAHVPSCELVCGGLQLTACVPRGRERSRSTWARGWGCRCWRWWRPSAWRGGRLYPMSYRIAVPATWLSATPTQARLRSSWGGERDAPWRICAATCWSGHG